MSRSQCDRIRDALRHGPTDQRAWNNPADGGEPIPQIARRIHDLRNRGYEIVDVEIPGCKFVAYRLVSEPNTGAPSARINPSSPKGESPARVAPASPPLLLSDPRPDTVPAPRCAINDDYDWEDAA